MEIIKLLGHLLLTTGINVILPLVITSDLFRFIFKKINLKQISKYDGCIIKDISFKDNINLNKEIDYDKIKELLPYLQKLNNYTSSENLKTVYKNLQSITIKINPFMILSIVTGSYDSKKNKVVYSGKKVLGHEFLHIASSYYDEENDIIYSGFKQQKGSVSIGKGLNEGYTELLNSRIYYKKNKVKTYKKASHIANLFEFFFDDSKDMEKYYFNHDLPGFIHHMEKFAPREEIIKLILKIDSIYLEPFGVTTSVDNIRIQTILYNWFKKSNNDSTKLKEFEELVCKNKLVSLVTKGQKLKLNKQNKYANKNDDIKKKIR